MEDGKRLKKKKKKVKFENEKTLNLTPNHEF